jgi:antirestriction protein ArdC
METPTKTKIDVYQMITDRIIESLESGIIPWKQPWTEAGLPQNLVTGKAYTGINLLLLASMGFPRNYFLTFKQIKDLKGSVKKGEKSIPVIFWKWSEKEDPQTKELKKVSMIRYYTVFNVDQCNDLPEERIPVIENDGKMEMVELEHIIEDMPQRPPIVHKENQAYYHPVKDFINMPKMNNFKDAESYWGTLFHELIHSTGHSTRLNRKEIVERTTFGTEPYSMEELVAEIGACYLKSYCGIGSKDFENNVAYIQHWLKKLRDDKRLIVYSSAKAQRAVDYILNVKPIEQYELNKHDEN